MSTSFAPCVGAVFSADIAVPEHAHAVRFYSRVLSTGDAPLWREADLMNNLGIPIIGLGARTPEYAHLPIQWMPHIQVADVALSVERTLELGGQVLMHAQDAAGKSQFAVLLDPDGAAFGIIPIVDEAALPPGVNDSPDSPPTPMGRIAWLDLTIPDATATRDFYQQVVGWAAQDLEMGKGDDRYADYVMLGGDGNPAAGVCHARGPNAGLPPVWMIYLPVGDLAESLRRVPVEGGKVMKAMQKDDGAYVYAMVQDPVGAYVALVPGT